MDLNARERAAGDLNARERAAGDLITYQVS